MTQLLGGLALYGAADALIVRAGLGLAPWDVLHQGLERTVGLSIGAWLLIVGVAVLLFWIPLRQRPGLGTVLNGLVIGGVLDATLLVLPAPGSAPARAAFLAAGVLLTGVATGAYIGAGLGPGPRDGLMTGLAARGHSLRVVRTGLELSVLAAGWALGGTVGIGTVAFALGIGPLAHVFLPRLTVTAGPPEAAAGGTGSAAGETAPAAAGGMGALPSEAGA